MAFFDKMKEGMKGGLSKGKEALSRGKDALEDLKEFSKIGSWFKKTLEKEKSLPESYINEWKRLGIPIKDEMQKNKEELTLENKSKKSGFMGSLKKGTKLTVLKATQAALHLKMKKAKSDMGRFIFEHRTDMEEIPEELEDAFANIKKNEENK